MSELLKTKLHTKPISWFIELQNEGVLNLSPGFQRKSVWSEKDRCKLMISIFEGFPVPSVFLYKREHEDGSDVFDVLDGKQRLESIFGYCKAKKFARKGYDVKFHFEDDPNYGDRPYLWQWRHLSEDAQYRVLNYKIQVVEVSGELDAIRDLFVRINSTGKKLTQQEQRHAKYVNSEILSEAERLARKLRRHLTADRVITKAQIDRMKDTELVTELLISFYQGGSINKKAAVDMAMSGGAPHLGSLGKAAREIETCYKIARTILPDIKTTRYRNISEFYSLLMTIRRLREEGRDLTDRQDQVRAAAMLKRLSNKANQVQEDRRALNARLKVTPLVRDYLMAVEQSADAKQQRNKREKILCDILGPLFNSQRDPLRRFTMQQRQLIWASNANAKCPGTKTRKCGKVLSWDDFHADHIKPWSKGGATDIANAKALCPNCNASKGNR